MPRFQHILFPVDFSERCRAIRPFVTALAERFHAKATLMHVIQIPVGWYGGMEAAYPVMFDFPAMEDEVRSGLQSFFSSPDAEKIRLEHIVVDHGDPATNIIDYAHANGVDLIMLPTHGYGRLRAMLLGSVTAKVLHDAKCPVWTSCQTEETKVEKRLKNRNMVCAIDTTPDSVDTIRYASGLASEFEASLRLVHAVPVAESLAATGEEDAFNRFLLSAAREEVAKLQQSAGTRWEVCIEGGSISKVVHDAAVQHDADLLIIGRGKQHEFLGRLRTHAYAIIRDAPCPVLSV